MTLDVKSAPWARPQAATAPLARVAAQALASVWLPAVSSTPDQASFCIGLPAADSVARSMMRAAPSSRR